jgi:predicted dehydrogenase
MRIGILGAGFMGQTHARAYAKIPGVEIVAISSQHRDKAERLTAEVGGKAVTDDRAIIEDPDRCDQQHVADALHPTHHRRAQRRQACPSRSRSR